MLHERNPEVLDLFKEGEEVACFDSAESSRRRSITTWHIQ